MDIVLFTFLFLTVIRYDTGFVLFILWYCINFSADKSVRDCRKQQKNIANDTTAQLKTFMTHLLCKVYCTCIADDTELDQFIGNHSQLSHETGTFTLVLVFYLFHKFLTSTDVSVKFQNL